MYDSTNSGKSVMLDRMAGSPSVPQTFGARSAKTHMSAPQRQQLVRVLTKCSGGSICNGSLSMFRSRTLASAAARDQHSS